MAIFLVAANRWPKDVVLDRVVVLEVDGGALLDHYDVRNIRQAALTHECGF